MTERARAILDKLRNGKPISGDELNEIYAALPPQNREADMPDAIWAYRNKYCHENFGRLWSDEEHVNPCVKYIRADLANKPALDAEVREAGEWLNNFEIMACALASNQRPNLIMVRDTLETGLPLLRKIIRAIAKNTEEPLCEDEGCPQHGTPHVCVSPSTSPKPREGGDAIPCVACGNPSDTQTPDDADMCWKCFGEFNAAEYDSLKKADEKLIGVFDRCLNWVNDLIECSPCKYTRIGAKDWSKHLSVAISEYRRNGGVT